MLEIKSTGVFLVAGVIAGLGLLEWIGGFYGKTSKKTQEDWLIEVFSLFQLSLIIEPLIVIIVAVPLGHVYPELQNIYQDTPLYFAIPFILLSEDFLQYWYHRKAHQWNWLWHLHKTHHSGQTMGVLVTYRNAAGYYILLPNLWWLGVLTYLGLYQAVIFSIIIKQIVVLSAHSETRWDLVLYQNRFLHKITYFLERIISTPSTHFAHHGKSEEDGISNPNGNFGNLFFFWDLLFGTARITRKYPEEFGLANEKSEPWTVQLFYPLIRSKKTETEV